MKDISLYHITHIDNLPEIFKTGNIYCKNKLIDLKLNFSSIAYEELQERRQTCEVPLEPYGVLHDYVPFFFAPRPPMLLAISSGRVETYEGSQNEIVYIVIKLKDIIEHQLQFVFTNGHAIIFNTEYYNDPEIISDVIDWDLMRERYWHDTLEDNDRKRRRQAEFLIYDQIPCELINGFYTMNARIKYKVQKIVEKHDLETPIETKPEWYY